jgi:hypothetical protein
MLNEVLLKSQYSIQIAEVGTVISVDEFALEDKLKSSERYILNRCRKSGFTCKQLTLENLDSVYQFIYGQLTLKGYSLSMSFDDLKKTVDNFPNQFFLFVVMDGDRMAAASVSIQVRSAVLYNFYVAHDPEYNHMSPVVMVVDGLYNFCKKNKFSILDLGTSMLDGKPNVTLLDFKLRLGGVVTEKITFSNKLV